MGEKGSAFLWGPSGVFASSPSYEVVAFLDLDNPVVGWAIQRGVLVSSRYASPTPQPGFTSMMMAGMVASGTSARLARELAIEEARLYRGFSGQVSRLLGMYFFRTRQEAESRIGDPLWPPYFRSANLVSMRLYSHQPPSVVDADWITHAPILPTGELDPKHSEWMSRYWAGEPRGSAPVWEVIAEGVAVVLDEEMRRLCYIDAKQNFPRAEIPLLMSRLASEAGTLGGVVAPFLTRVAPDRVSLQFCIRDADFHDPTIIEEMSKHPDFGYLADQIRKNETWRLPDFSPWNGQLWLPGHSVSADTEAATIHQS